MLERVGIASATFELWRALAAPMQPPPPQVIICPSYAPCEYILIDSARGETTYVGRCHQNPDGSSTHTVTTITHLPPQVHSKEEGCGKMSPIDDVAL